MHDVSPFVLRRMLALRQFPMFAGAELGELAMLAENVAETTLSPGTLVAAAGVRPPALHLVLEGALAAPAEGRTWGPRHVFGTLEVLARRALATPVIATRATRTLALYSTEITEVLDENFGVLRATVQELAARMIAHAHVPPIAVPDIEPLGFVDRLIVLRQHLPFADARLDALASLAHSSEELELAPGAILARRGDVATSMLVVLDGVVHAIGADAAPRAIQRGQAIAAFETLAEQAHPHTLEAATRVRVLASSAASIYDVIEDHTDLGLAMIRGFAAALLDARDPRAPATAQALRS